MLVDISLIGFIIFMCVMWLSNRVNLRALTAAVLTVVVFLVVKILLRIIPYYFFRPDADPIAVLSSHDIVTALIQIGVFYVIFGVLRRYDDSIAIYVGMTVVGGLIGFMIIPSIVSSIMP